MLTPPLRNRNEDDEMPSSTAGTTNVGETELAQMTSGDLRRPELLEKLTDQYHAQAHGGRHRV